MSHVDTPLKWLLAQLPTHIDSVPLEGLIQRFEAQKARYNRQVKIRDLERRIAIYERWPKRGNLPRAQAQLAKLKEEQERG